MPPGVGHLTQAQIFLEADNAWATRVITGGTKLEIDSVGVNIDQGFVASKAMYGGLTARELYQLGVKYAGRISGEMRYEGLAKLLACGLGERPTFSTSATSVKSGQFHVAKTAQVSIPSLSMELVEGGVVKSGGDCTLVLGAMLPRIKFTVAGGLGDEALMRFDADVLARSKVPQTTPQLTASLPTPNIIPIVFGDCETATFLDGTADAAGTQNVTSVELEITKPMKLDRFFVSAGSRNFAQPLWNGQALVVWTIKREFQSYSALDAAQNWADGNLKMKFISGTNIAGSSPTTPYSITFETKKAKIIGTPDVSINDFGVIEETTKWQAKHATTQQVAGIDDGPLVVTYSQSYASLVTAGA